MTLFLGTTQAEMQDMIISSCSDIPTLLWGSPARILGRTIHGTILKDIDAHFCTHATAGVDKKKRRAPFAPR
jgi:hypothetical protein